MSGMGKGTSLVEDTNDTECIWLVRVTRGTVAQVGGLKPVTYQIATI